MTEFFEGFYVEPGTELHKRLIRAYNYVPANWTKRQRERGERMGTALFNRAHLLINREATRRQWISWRVQPARGVTRHDIYDGSARFMVIAKRADDAFNEKKSSML